MFPLICVEKHYRVSFVCYTRVLCRIGSGRYVTEEDNYTGDEIFVMKFLFATSTSINKFHILQLLLLLHDMLGCL